MEVPTAGVDVNSRAVRVVGSHESAGSCAHWSQPPSAVFKQMGLLSQKAPLLTWPGILILEGA